MSEACRVPGERNNDTQDSKENDQEEKDAK